MSFVWLRVNRLLDEAGGKISDIEIPLEPDYIFIGQVEPIQLQEGMTLKLMQALNLRTWCDLFVACYTCDFFSIIMTS